MKNKKLSFILLLNLILFFIILIILYLQFNANKSSIDTTEIDSKIAQVSGEIEDIRVRLDQWESLINGEQSVDISVEEQENDSSEEEKKGGESEEPIKEEEEEPKEETLTVTGNEVNVRATPSTNANIISVLNKGNKVKSVGKTEEASGYTWVEITLSNGNKGWIVKDFVE